MLNIGKEKCLILFLKLFCSPDIIKSVYISNNVLKKLTEFFNLCALRTCLCKYIYIYLICMKVGKPQPRQLQHPQKQTSSWFSHFEKAARFMHQESARRFKFWHRILLTSFLLSFALVCSNEHTDEATRMKWTPYPPSISAIDQGVSIDTRT